MKKIKLFITKILSVKHGYSWFIPRWRYASLLYENIELKKQIKFYENALIEQQKKFYELNNN